MTDLRTLLDDAAGPAPATSTATLDGDLGRGRSALRRRRLRTRGGGALLAAAAVALVAVGGGGVLGGAGTPPPVVTSSSDPTAPAAPSAPAEGAVRLELVAYTAAQPVGFDVAEVPAGWTIRSSDAASFVITPPGAPAEEEEPGSTSFVDAVAVSLVATAPVDLAAADLSVDGDPAVVFQNEGGGRTLFVALDEGRVLSVQVWEGIDLTQQQVLDLAGGITVADGAVVSVG